MSSKRGSARDYRIASLNPVWAAARQWGEAGRFAGKRSPGDDRSGFYSVTEMLLALLWRQTEQPPMQTLSCFIVTAPHTLPLIPCAPSNHLTPYRSFPGNTCTLTVIDTCSQRAAISQNESIKRLPIMIYIPMSLGRERECADRVGLRITLVMFSMVN